jgi:GABA(A) receptor-associated protein
MGFKKDFEIHVRKCESQKIMTKYPGKIPVIVEKQAHSDMPNIDKKKYLVPGDLNMSHFIYVVRKRIKLEPSETLFLMVDNRLCPSNALLSDIYGNYKDEDGFLYIVYSAENTFG